jgi:hypothetical protein
MSNPKTNNDRQSIRKNESHLAKVDQTSHFAHARKIIKSWPEWKRNICCAPRRIAISEAQRKEGSTTKE